MSPRKGKSAASKGDDRKPAAVIVSPTRRSHQTIFQSNFGNSTRNRRVVDVQGTAIGNGSAFLLTVCYEAAASAATEPFTYPIKEGLKDPNHELRRDYGISFYINETKSEGEDVAIRTHKGYEKKCFVVLARDDENFFSEDGTARMKEVLERFSSVSYLLV